MSGCLDLFGHQFGVSKSVLLQIIDYMDEKNEILRSMDWVNEPMRNKLGSVEIIRRDWRYPVREFKL